jgi:hypothetical protein
MLIILVDEVCQFDRFVIPKHPLQSTLQSDIELFDVVVKLLTPQNLGDLLQLVVVIRPFEKGILLENLI